MTGDQADNMQRNEMIWTRRADRGRHATDFGSGVDGPELLRDQRVHLEAELPGLLPWLQDGGKSPPGAIAAEAARYTGVQDYDDYPAATPGRSPPTTTPTTTPRRGQYADWPSVPGPDGPGADAQLHPGGPRRPLLLDQRQPRRARPGQRGRQRRLRGHRDRLLQGARHHRRRSRPRRPAPTSPRTRTCCSSPASVGMLVPPDPLRRFVDRPQIKAVIGANDVDNDHGFGFVSAAENTASDGTASYYAWDPPADPRLPLHQHRHQLRGRPDGGGRRLGLVQRQHRRSSVPVAEAGARRRPGRRQADRPLRAPPGAQHGHGDRRRAGGASAGMHRCRTIPTETRPSTTPTRAATATRGSRPRSTSARTPSRRPARELRRAARRTTRT